MNKNKLSSLVSKLPPKSRVIDAGCGNFETLNFINNKQSNLQLFGIDKTKPVTIPSEIQFKRCDFEKDNFPYPENYFDLVISQHTLEHLNNPLFYFENLVKCLKPGGVIYIEAPSDKSTKYSYPKNQNLNLILSFYDDPTHIGRPWTPQSLYRLGRYFDLEILEARYIENKLDFFLLPLEYIVWRITKDSDRFIRKYWSATGWVVQACYRKKHKSTKFSYFSFKGIK